LPKIDTTLFEALVTEKDYKKIVAQCILTRGIKVKRTQVPVPVSYAAAFEGERVKEGTVIRRVRRQGRVVIEF